MKRYILDTQKLKDLLEEQKMTQKELAKRAGTTEVSISRYVSGQRIPRLLKLASIAEVLGVGIDELITKERQI